MMKNLHRNLRLLALGLVAMMAVAAFEVFATTYVVCVGIADYASPKVRDLSKSEKDADEMAAFYGKATKEVTLLKGRQATKKNILQTASSVFGKAGKNDRIIFFFSGHGYPGGFCPYEMESEAGGLTYRELFKVMQKSAAGTKIIFADACNSGAIRSGKKGNSQQQPDPGSILMFLSSRGYELSIESPFMPNGMFTKYLLKGLRGGADANRDRCVTAKELFTFVNGGVVKQSGGRQHPVMWGKFDDGLILVDYRRR